MTNPYEVPQAVLENEVLPLRKKTGWKIFFWTLCVLYIAILTLMYFESDVSATFKVTEMFVYYGVLVGLFCFAYNKRFLQQRVWQFFFPLAIAWDIYSVGSSFMETTIELTSENFFFILIYVLMISPIYIFQYFALYQYAFQSKEIWAKS